MPVPTAVPPSGTSATPRQRRLEPLDAEPHLRGVAAELLAEGHRGGVHQVGAAGLDDVRALGRLALERRREVLAAPGSRSWTTAASVAATCTRGREHVVRRLRGVDVVVRVHRAAEALRRRASRAPRSCSCSIECPSRSGRRRSGTGRRRCPRRPRRRRRRSRRRRPASSTPSSALTRAAAALMRASACDLGRLEAVAPEIGKFSTARWVWARHSASRGDAHLAHRVVLDAVLARVRLLVLHVSLRLRLVVSHGSHHALRGRAPRRHPGRRRSARGPRPARRRARRRRSAQP